MLARQMGMERHIWEEVTILRRCGDGRVSHGTSNLIVLLHGVIPGLAFASPIIRLAGEAADDFTIVISHNAAPQGTPHESRLGVK